MGHGRSPFCLPARGNARCHRCGPGDTSRPYRVWALIQVGHTVYPGGARLTVPADVADKWLAYGVLATTTEARTT
jgi:hypothetical protein